MERWSYAEVVKCRGMGCGAEVRCCAQVCSSVAYACRPVYKHVSICQCQLKHRRVANFATVPDTTNEGCSSAALILSVSPYRTVLVGEKALQAVSSCHRHSNEERKWRAPPRAAHTLLHGMYSMVIRHQAVSAAGCQQAAAVQGVF